MFLKYRSWWRLDPDLDLDPYLHFMLDPDLFPPVQCTCCSVIESEICSLGELLQLLLRSFMWSSSSNSSSSHSPRLDNAALLQLFLETYFTELLSSPNRSQQVSIDSRYLPYRIDGNRSQLLFRVLTLDSHCSWIYPLTLLHSSCLAAISVCSPVPVQLSGDQQQQSLYSGLQQCFGSGSARIRIKICLLDPDPDPGSKKA